MKILLQFALMKNLFLCNDCSNPIVVGRACEAVAALFAQSVKNEVKIRNVFSGKHDRLLVWYRFPGRKRVLWKDLEKLISLWLRRTWMLRRLNVCSSAALILKSIDCQQKAKNRKAMAVDNDLARLFGNPSEWWTPSEACCMISSRVFCGRN